MGDTKSKRIPLCLSGGNGVPYRGWTVTQGIPFAKGDLPRGTSARVVDGDGKVYRSQTAVLAWWDKAFTWPCEATCFAGGHVLMAMP